MDRSVSAANFPTPPLQAFFTHRLNTPAPVSPPGTVRTHPPPASRGLSQCRVICFVGHAPPLPTAPSHALLLQSAGKPQRFFYRLKPGFLGFFFPPSLAPPDTLLEDRLLGFFYPHELGREQLSMVDSPRRCRFDPPLTPRRF